MVDPVLAGFGVVAAIMALVMLLSRNPITSALSLVVVMVCLSAVYAMIGSHFIAAVQLIVYAGAVMVLFVFSIMLLNLNKSEQEIKLGQLKPAVSALITASLFGILTYGVIKQAQVGAIPVKEIFSPEKIRELGGNVEVLSTAMFSRYIVTFEAIGVLLLVATVGAVVLAKRRVD